MGEITLEQANTIIAAALSKGRVMNLPPLSVAVLDSGGHVKAIVREDGQSFMRVRVAQSKAWGALALGVHSRHIAERYEQSLRQEGFIGALNDLSGGQVIPLPGAVLVRREGGVIGAVGVAGAASEDDELCAVAGVEAIGVSVDLDS